MKSGHFVYAILCLLLFVSQVSAADSPRFLINGGTIHGGPADLAKAGADTINLMGSRNDPTNGPGEPIYFGDFEDASGNPAWNGWTHHDITQPTETNWNVSNYNQPDPGNQAAWCGDITLASCGPDDPEGGYGNSWDDLLEFRYSVPHPDSSSTVTISATLIHDSEPTYDYTYLSYRYQGQLIADIQGWDGKSDPDPVDGRARPIAITSSVSYLPQEYLNGTDIAVYFRFKSDGGWSDADCSFESAGGCQVDDINVHLVNGEFTGDFFEDFEHGGDPGDFGIWNVALPPGVGDFAKIWIGLQDLDPCQSNYSPQVAFIDDGQVVPGTGGSPCINWCYGPGGYIVNTTGGLAGPEGHLHNVIDSPVMEWPPPKSGSGPDYDGIILDFDVYRHEDLTADSPGIFYCWGIRSADTDGSDGPPQDIMDQPYLDRGSCTMYGGPDYARVGDKVTDLMNAGRDEVQVRLEVYELGYNFFWTGNDGYPAPYFDNVTVKVFPHLGPGMFSRELDLANDNWPARGSIDYGDLPSHSVRFDMANNISPAGHLRNDPGDSMVVDVAPVRAGGVLTENPRLYYHMQRNPVFDAGRTSGLPDIGSVLAMPAARGGNVVPDKWAFDLPDTGFFFPGDVLHYYIGATDDVDGDLQTTILPADTTGFSTGFGDPLGYNSTFVIRALPSIREDGFGGYYQPKLLFLNDFANRGGENKWYMALNNIGLLVEEDYDVYYTNGPSSGVGNGIGGRTNDLVLAGYDDILYTSGNLGVNTISNGDFQNDAGDDVGVLTAWLDQGGKDMFLTGDDLASDLAQAGSATLDFLGDKMGVSLVTSNIRPLIGNQTTPMVQVVPGNPVFLPGGSVENWIAYGACPARNTFDGVDPYGAGQRLAEFTDPLGEGYDYSACTLNILNPGPDQSRVISMPVDLMYVITNPESPSNGRPTRANLLDAVLQYFGIEGGEPSGTSDLPGLVFSVTNYPNPFNPATTVTYSLPRAGHLKLSIYNVRGQLIRTLIDGPRPAGADQTIVWDGTDNLGSAAASGVYFYEARALDDVRIGKATLLK